MSTLTYHHDPDPTEGTLIEASHCGAYCLTECKHVPGIMVGSLRCHDCEHYAGSAGKATIVNDGKGAYGAITHTRTVWCKQSEDKA